MSRTADAPARVRERRSTAARLRLRYLPHYDGQIEVFSTEEWARHLGSAYLAQAATLEQRCVLSSVREKKARALKADLKADLKAAEKPRKARYTATTTAAVPRPRRTVTSSQALGVGRDLRAVWCRPLLCHGGVLCRWLSPRDCILWPTVFSALWRTILRHRRERVDPCEQPSDTPSKASATS